MSSALLFDKMLSAAVEADDPDEMERTYSMLDTQVPPPALQFDDAFLLLSAVKGNKMAAVRHLIEKRHVSINCTGRMKVNRGQTQCATPLFTACAYGHEDIVRYLVDHGANVSQRNEFGESPLHIACKCGHVPIVSFLAETVGVDLEEYSALGRTPLLTAAAEGHVNVIQSLISAGANLNTKTIESGGSCLHACSFVSGSVEAAKLILANGVTPEPNRFGILPILDAAAMGNEEILNFWVNYYNLSELDNVVLVCNALMLAGTNFWRRNKSKAFKYFHHSFKIRQEYHLPNETLMPLAPVNEYLDSKEVSTMEELQELYVSEDTLQLQQHCFMVRERILGSCHVTIARPCITYGYYLARIGHEQQVMPMWLYVLDRQVDRFLRDGHPTLAYATLFTLAQSLRLRELEAVNPLPALERLLLILERLGKLHERSWVMCELGLHFLSLVLNHANAFPGSIDHTHVVQLARHFMEIAPLGPRGQTLLHCAVSAQTTSLHTDSCLGLELRPFPCIETIRCLLAAGASVNSVDSEKNTPLHMLIESTRGSVSTEIVKLLLKFGSYPSARNANRARPIFFCKNSEVDVFGVLRQAETISLQTFAACAIVDHKVPYRDVLSHKLVEYVGMH
jgi:ankyrin repeat protein